jgi:hypothetical protein
MQVFPPKYQPRLGLKPETAVRDPLDHLSEDDPSERIRQTTIRRTIIRRTIIHGTIIRHS